MESLSWIWKFGGGFWYVKKSSSNKEPNYFTLGNCESQSWENILTIYSIQSLRTPSIPLSPVGQKTLGQRALLFFMVSAPWCNGFFWNVLSEYSAKFWVSQMPTILHYRKEFLVKRTTRFAFSFWQEVLRLLLTWVSFIVINKSWAGSLVKSPKPNHYHRRSAFTDFSS